MAVGRNKNIGASAMSIDVDYAAEMEFQLNRQRLRMEVERERAKMMLMAGNPFIRMPDGRWDLSIMDEYTPPENLSSLPKTEPDRKSISRLGVALADENEGENALAKEAEALLGYNVLRRKLKIPGKLGEVLALLDIEPLDFDAVEKYKADMILWRKAEFAKSPQSNYRTSLDVSWRRITLGDCKEEVPLFALRKALQVKKACPTAILEVDELIEQKKLIDPFLVARLDDETYYLEVWKEPKFEETL